MRSIGRRRFLANLLTVLPALRLSIWGAAPASAESGPQGPARGVLVASGADRFHVARAIGVSVTAFKVSAEDTRHSLFAMEQTNTKHGGPPLHLHHGVDEFWYVIDGDYLIEVGGEQFRAHAGDCVLGPRSVPHRWAFVGPSSGRLLITFTPAGRMEEYFARPRKPGEYMNDPALYRRFGMELLGPSLSVE